MDVVNSNLGDNPIINHFIKIGAESFPNVPYEELYDLKSDPYQQNNLIDNIIKVSQGLFFIFWGVKLWFFFKPSSTEMSLALLIEYFRKKGDISEDFYKILKKFKPNNIEKYV